MEASELLKQTSIFAELSAADQDALSESARIVTYKAGEAILREGRVGAAFFIVVSGKVEVVKGMGGPESKVVATLGAGEFFGEIAAMKHVTRSASVLALTETQCLVIQRLHFDSFIERFPNLLAKVNAALSARFAEK